MKFLVDVGVGKKVENWLKENGFDVLSVRDIDSRAKDSQIESFELLLKFGNSSFLRKQESSSFKAFWIPAYAGMTKWGYFSKLSYWRTEASTVSNRIPSVRAWASSKRSKGSL